MDGKSERKREFSNSDRWLLVANLLGPMAVLANLNVAYSLAPSACADGSKTMLHVVTAGFLLVTVAAALMARHFHLPRNADDESVSEDRRRFMAVSAVVLALTSALAILAMEIPHLILRSCD